uniref:Acylglycerol kinase, mitochondrial n=2 Tax=Cacopsylla melanoneura TaxID=428564 RepID=A0A8D9BA04_9HEMI
MVLKILTTLRNNWKKTVFGGVVVAYGTNYVINRIECNNLMTAYCQRAVQYGEQPIGSGAPLRRIIVILNPAADKRSAKKNFEKYCAPILHLSGALVDVKVTKGEGDARKLVESLKERVDAIVIAGGDGTISEVVTGLLRGFDHDCSMARRLPIGILPLGRNNHIARAIYGDPSDRDGQVETAEALARATMTVVEQARSSEMNALCVQVLQQTETEDGSEAEPSSLVPDSNKFYALHSIEWGNLKNAQTKRDKYWYLGPLKPYLTYAFNGLSLDQVKARVLYSAPCSGCKQCYTKRSDVRIEPKKQWFEKFVTKNTADVKSKNYALIENAQCGVLNQRLVSSMDMRVTVMPPPHMTFVQGPDSYNYQDFVKLGWDYEKTNRLESTEQLQAQQLDIIPETNEEVRIINVYKGLYYKLKN